MKTELVLDACETLLREAPADEVTLTMIAQRAGTTRTSVYHFFPSKSEVFTSLSNKYYDEIRGRIVRAINPETVIDFEFAWAEITNIFCDYFKENAVASRLLLGKKGGRQLSFADEQSELSLVRAIHSIISEHTNCRDLLNGDAPTLGLIQTLFELMTSLFSSSVRREGEITDDISGTVNRTAMAYLSAQKKSIG